MSTEKLSKPVAYTDADELRFHHATSDMWPVPLGFGKDVPLYSQEYVSALKQRIAELESKLAKPIQIVNYDEFFICHVSGASDDYCKGWVDGRNAAARDVVKAGFTVEGGE